MGVGLWLWICAGAASLLLLFYVVGLYNRLVLVRSNVEKAWSNIDVLLKQRHDELPNLVETCKGYVTHESSTLQAITRLREQYAAAGTIPDKARIENDLVPLVWGLYRAVEAYPDLKANLNFLKLQDRITALDTAIAARREFFNDSVNLYNTRIQCFPELLLAGPLGFAKMEFLAAAANEKNPAGIHFPPVGKG